MPQGFGPETLSFVKKFWSLRYRGWDPPKPYGVYMGVITNGDGFPATKMMEFIGILLHYLVSSGGSNLMPNVAGDFEGFFRK